MSDPEQTPPAAPVAAPAKTFSEDYVRELREENKTWRQKAQGHETAATTAKREADEAKAAAVAAKAVAETDASARIAAAETAARTAADARVIRAELRALATKAGMVDLDGLKLLDTAALTINDAGDVVGADALIAAAKVAKPYLFGATNTGNPAPPPPARKPSDKPAKDMTDDEFNASLKSRAWRK